MTQNVKLKSRSMRGLFYSPKSKLNACPSFLMKNQKSDSFARQSSMRNSHKLSFQQFQPRSQKFISTTLGDSNMQFLKPSNTDQNQVLKVKMVYLDTGQHSQQNQEQRQNSEAGTYGSTDGSPFQININTIMGNKHQTMSALPIRKSKSFLSKSGDHRSYSSANKSFISLLNNISLSENGGSPRSLKQNELQVGRNVGLNDFLMIKQLGKGKTSSVFLARHKYMGMIVAIKIISKELIRDEKLEQHIFRQIKLLSHIKHQNIINLYKVFSDKNNVYMVFEYMGGTGNLFSVWKSQKKFNEKQTKKILVDVCNAVRFLHRNDIIHRDIKLENILFMNGVAKLADLGCAVHSIYMRKSQVGSPTYLSPEQLSNGFYNKKIDIWSIGIMTYEMLIGFSPFNQQILKLLSNQKDMPSLNLEFPEDVQISEIAKNFISKLLIKNPNERVSIESALNHPFLQQTFKDQKKSF